MSGFAARLLFESNNHSYPFIQDDSPLQETRYRECCLQYDTLSYTLVTLPPWMNCVQYARGCAVRARMRSMNQGKSSVQMDQMRICSTSEAHLQYKVRYAGRATHIFCNTNEDVQYERGISSSLDTGGHYSRRYFE